MYVGGFYCVVVSLVLCMFCVCVSGVYDEGIYDLLLISCMCLNLHCDLVP